MGPWSIAVVIPARNAAGHLPGCLAAILEQDPPPAEIVVVDDGSTDDTVEVAERFGARVVRLGDHRWVSAARNAGARAVRSEVIAFMDADDRPAPGWTAGITAAIAAGATLVGFDRIQSGRPEPVARHVEGRWARTAPGGEGWPATLPAWLNNFAIRRPVFLELGGFDEDLHACEDSDFALRAALAGHLAAPSSARYVATPRTSLRGLARQRFTWAYWSVVVERKHGALPFAFRPPVGLGRRVASAAVETLARLLLRQRTAAQDSVIELVHLVALVTGRATARASLAVGRRRVSIAPEPADIAPARVGAGLPPGPRAILVGERRMVWALARALTADPAVAAPPPGLLPSTREGWAGPPPPAPQMVRRARRRGWHLRVDLAVRRIAAAQPRTAAEAVLLLHGVQAWQTRADSWVLAAPGSAGPLAAERFAGAALIAAGEVPQLGREVALTVDRKALRHDRAGIVAALAPTIGLRSPERVTAVLRYAVLTRFLR